MVLSVPVMDGQVGNLPHAGIHFHANTSIPSVSTSFLESKSCFTRSNDRESYIRKRFPVVGCVIFPSKTHWLSVARNYEPGKNVSITSKPPDNKCSRQSRND